MVSTDASFGNVKLIECRDCGLCKPSAFSKHKTRGYQNQCKECRSRYNKKHYANNKARYRKAAKQSRTRLRKEAKEKLYTLLLRSPCQTCGEADPVVLDFHHRNPKHKKFAISWAVQHGLSWDKIAREIRKCYVLCANDHRREHAKKHGSYRYLLGR